MRKIHKVYLQKGLLSIGIGSILSWYGITQYISHIRFFLAEMPALQKIDETFDWSAILFLSTALLIGIFSLFAAPLLSQKKESFLQGIKITLVLLSFIIIFLGIVVSGVTGKVTLFCVVTIWLSVVYISWVTMDILQIIYQWLKSEDGSFDLAKMVFIWGIVGFIIGKVW